MAGKNAHFDVVVIGAGSGLTIVDKAADMGLKVALAEEGPMGGTCLNRGCIPSKMLIHSADVAETIAHAAKFGIMQKGYTVDFPGIVRRVSGVIDADAREIEEGILQSENITLFKKRAVFVGEKKLKVGSRTITGDKIVIFAGTREFVPPIEGLDKVQYMTSTEALRLTKQPKSLTIIGGGFIAAELGHFFGALGTKVTIIQRNDVLVPAADRETAEAFTRAFKKKHTVLLNATAAKVERKAGKYVVTAASNDGKVKKRVISDQLLLAAGRRPNSDILAVEKTGVKVNQRGFIETNEYLETSVPGIWAAGDIAGKYMFKHSANLEAAYLAHNLFSEKKLRVDYGAMPSAVFSSPQIASVGVNEDRLEKGTYGVGRYEYSRTGMGAALQEEDGFVKILVDKNTRKILGCHIIGPDASTLIQEVIVAMHIGSGTVDGLTRTVHIHPALPEVVQRAANSVKF